MPRTLTALVRLVGSLVLLASCAAPRAGESASTAATGSLPADVAPATNAPSSAADVGGIGSLTARTDSGEPLLLRLESVHVVAEQRGDMAAVEVTHRFRNDSDRVLEGTFRFPMPDGALLTGLSMVIDGKRVDGELVERDKAKKAYEAVVDGMQDPALLEWEHGSVFKLRVFPLEPLQPKIVSLRYLTPLRRTGRRLEFVQGASGPNGGEPVPALAIDWEGKRVVSEHDVKRERVFAVPAKPASPVLVEKRTEGSYALVRVAPDWSRIPPDPKSAPKHWFVVVDTSRSALEEFPRTVEALGTLLAKLPPGSDFQVVTSDLTAQALSNGLTPATADSIAAARATLAKATPDGASDLGRALELVGKLSKAAPDSAVLYLGDCEPSWGLTRASDVRALMERELPGVPFYPVLFGASVDDGVATELAEASGGRRTRVHREEDVTALAGVLGRPAARLRNIEITAAPGVEVLPNAPPSLERGDELVIVAKAPRGVDPLLGLRVRGKSASGALVELSPRARPEQAAGVARRFGAALVQKLERTGAPPADVVKASLDYGVMSRFTSFLVLESEEAYARFAIERRQRQADDAPRVTGQDLESADGASISADRIQPGDPEIYVDAERDALEVTVEFPFGETKRATWDADAQGGRGAWLVRFLVPRAAEEGSYQAVVRLVHRDGRRETRTVSYTVDRTAPELEVRLEKSGRAGFVSVTVTQAHAGPTSDLRRVELCTPAGRVHELTALRWGVFRAILPAAELERGTLRVVGFDQALNHATQELELP
ncbi:MAG TPA: VIT and VWA domain-containing protein [Polyangiaceae bacterium]|nr:VIT and VWA domain-containing protein [Polyangiaceae bacterium]